jgi:hypothetical protein
MKKNVLNLSLLMLLSAPFNAFGMEGRNSEGWKKFFYMFSPTTTAVSPEQCVNSADEVLKTSSDVLQSAIQVVQTSSNTDSGQVQTVVNSALAAIKNVNNVSQDAKFGALLEIRNNVVKLGQLLQGGLKIVYNKAIDNLPAIKTLVSSHPKISLAVGATVASVGSYAFYQYLSNQGIINPRNDLRSLSAQANEYSQNLASNRAESLNQDLGDLTEIDKQLEENLLNEVREIGGVDKIHSIKVNEADPEGTLLMKYSRDNNLPAVKYLIEKLNANPNIKDSAGRHLLVYPAFFGNAELVEYLAPRSEASAFTEARRNALIAFKENYFKGNTDEQLSNLNRILYALEA